MAKVEKKEKRNEDRSLTRTRKTKTSLVKGERSKQSDLAVPAASSKRGSNIMTQRRACSWYHKFSTASAKQEEEVMIILRRMGVSRRTIKVEWVRHGLELLTRDLSADPKCHIMLSLEDTFCEMVAFDNLLAMLEFGASVKRRTITISPA